MLLDLSLVFIVRAGTIACLSSCTQQLQLSFELGRGAAKQNFKYIYLHISDPHLIG